MCYKLVFVGQFRWCFLCCIVMPLLVLFCCYIANVHDMGNWNVGRVLRSQQNLGEFTTPERGHHEDGISRWIVVFLFVFLCVFSFVFPRLLSVVSMTWIWYQLMLNETVAKQILTASPTGNWRRQLRRPRITRMKTIQQDLKSSDLNMDDAVDLAQNRPLWRLMSTFGATHS